MSFKKVDQFDLEGNYIKTFNSTKEAAESVFVVRQAIGMCLTGKSSSSGGYKWKFTEQNNHGKDNIPTGGNQKRC